MGCADIATHAIVVSWLYIHFNKHATLAHNQADAILYPFILVTVEPLTLAAGGAVERFCAFARTVIVAF
jgi:hypothetical protein